MLANLTNSTQQDEAAAEQLFQRAIHYAIINIFKSAQDCHICCVMEHGVIAQASQGLELQKFRVHSKAHVRT